MDKLGISGIKAVLSFPLSIHMGYDKAQADGKIDVTDVGYLMDPVMKLVPAVQNSKQALEEIKDLDDSERAELNSWAKSEYDIKDDALEEKIEASIDVLLSIAVLVGKLSKKDAEELKAS